MECKGYAKVWFSEIQHKIQRNIIYFDWNATRNVKEMIRFQENAKGDHKGNAKDSPAKYKVSLQRKCYGFQGEYKAQTQSIC